jgi:hypothetical protein
VHHGVPFDVAFSLPDIDRQAWSIIFGQFDGGEFDFNSLAWKQPK